MNFRKVNLSGSDQSGVLYTDGARFLRGISHLGAAQVLRLFESGLIDELYGKGFIPETCILRSEDVPKSLSHYPLVIQHAAIRPLTYPREWSFEMVKSVALSFLELIEVLEHKGFTCKDAHLFNWAFLGIKPVWLDLTSFISIEKNSSRKPWLKEFWMSVYVPLLLWKKGMPFVASRIIAHPSQTMSESEAFTILHFCPPLPFLLKRVFLKVWSTYSSATIDSQKIRRMQIKVKSVWSDYHNEFLNKNETINIDSRFQQILMEIKKYQVESILELGGNAGVLSQIVARELPLAPVLCTDYDPLAIDQFVRRLKNVEIENISVAVIDFMLVEQSLLEVDPVLRFRSDCVLALALTHHLLLSQGYSYDQIFSNIRKYSSRLVMIEFMPLGLYSPGSKTAAIPEWYSEENFRSSFEQYFKVLDCKKLEVNRVIYVGELFLDEQNV